MVRKKICVAIYHSPCYNMFVVTMIVKESIRKSIEYQTKRNY